MPGSRDYWRTVARFPRCSAQACAWVGWWHRQTCWARPPCAKFGDAHTSAQATAAQYLKDGRMPATMARVRSVYRATRIHGRGPAPGIGRRHRICTTLAACLSGRALPAPVARDGAALAQRAIEKVAFCAGCAVLCPADRITTTPELCHRRSAKRSPEGVAWIGRCNCCLRTAHFQWRPNSSSPSGPETLASACRPCRSVWLARRQQPGAAGIHGVLGNAFGDAFFHQFKTFVELPAGHLVHAPD